MASKYQERASEQDHFKSRRSTRIRNQIGYCCVELASSSVEPSYGIGSWKDTANTEHHDVLASSGGGHGLLLDATEVVEVTDG
jgi:hypothetical protein